MRTLRKFLIFLALLMLISASASAYVVTPSTSPNFKIGNQQGLYNPATIKAADLYATDDLLVVDDAQVYDNLIVNGTIYTNTLSAGTNISTGHLMEDTTVDAGVDITAASGAEIFNYGSSTGAFTTGTGTNTLSGNTVIPGTKTFMVNGGAATFGAALTAASLVVNTTTDINGATTTAGITVDAWSTVTADQYIRRTNTTATNITILDNGADVYLVGNGTGVNTQTIVFPTASANKGRIITVILGTDPLTNSVVLDGEGDEQIDGAGTKTTTDAVGSMYHLICNGVGWIKIASLGTWS